MVAKKVARKSAAKKTARKSAKKVALVHSKPIKRASQITKKAPTKRLVKRRIKNTTPGYFPNPISEKLKYGVYQIHGIERMFVCAVVAKGIAEALATLLNKHAAKGVQFVAGPL